MSTHAYPPAPTIDVRVEGAAELCDVRQIMRRTLKGFSTMAQRLSHLRVRLVIAQISGHAWNFDMFLVLPSRLRAPWRLSAPTCALAAQRTAIKLGLLAPSLSWSPPPPLKEGEPSKSVPAPAPAPAPPALQRPRRVIQPPSRAPTTVIRSVPKAAGPPIVSPRGVALVAVLETDRLPPRTQAGSGRVRVRAEARVGHGVLPQAVAAGVRVVVAAFGRHVRTEFGATLDYAGQFTLAGDPRVHHPGRVAARVSFCRDFVVRSVDLHLCAGMDGGLIIMKSTDTTAKAWIVHLHASPGLTWWFNPQIGLFGGLSAGPALARPRFYVGPGPGRYAQLSQATPQGFLEAAMGLEIRFPVAGRRARGAEAIDVTPRRRADG